MSDFERASLPVRSSDDLDQRVLIKVQGLNVENADGTADVTDNQLHTKIFQSNGEMISEEMPLPVSVTESAGLEIEDYNEAVDVAPTVSSNHDYVVSAEKVLKKLNLTAAASGKARFELQVETGVATAVFQTKAVKFNSVSNPNVEFKLERPARVLAGVTIRLVKTNLDEQSQSIYSTINGVEL